MAVQSRQTMAASSRPKRARLGAFVGVWISLVCLGPIAGCGGSQGPPAGAKKGAKPGGKAKRGGGPGGWGQGERKSEALAVEMVAPTPRDIVRGYEASGTLEAIRRVEIRPTQAGVIDQLMVEEGAKVEEGQTLARLDTRELSLAARRDKVAAANARKQLERLDRLAEQRVASAEEVDQQRYAVASAEASAKLSRHQASRGSVRAPFAGTIVTRPLDPGHYVTPADVIYELADLDTLELALHVPEREAAKVKLEAPVQLSNLADEDFVGKVVRRAPVVDPLTGTVKFTVHSEGERPATAVPGAFVRALIELEAVRGVPTLPLSAIVEIGEEAFVYVIEQGKAVRRKVELGLRDASHVEITGGVDAGTQVVKEAREITDGMELKAFGSPDARAEHKGDGGKRREAG